MNDFDRNSGRRNRTLELLVWLGAITIAILGSSLAFVATHDWGAVIIGTIAVCVALVSWPITTWWLKQKSTAELTSMLVERKRAAKLAAKLNSYLMLAIALLVAISIGRQLVQGSTDSILGSVLFLLFLLIAGFSLKIYSHR